MAADSNTPTEPGIYPVQVADGDGSHYDCAMWDGECWRLWCDIWDPPEWDVAEHLNSRVIRCAMPERAFCATPPAAPAAVTITEAMVHAAITVYGASARHLPPDDGIELHYGLMRAALAAALAAATSATTKEGG